MPAPVHPPITQGRAYRTADFRQYGKNPARLAQRLVAEGILRQIARGLYVRPRPSKWGPTPVAGEELLRVYLKGAPFIITGPPIWNALGLGATALFALTLVYNRKRTGEVTLDGRRFLLRRVAFPDNPPLEYFVVDLLIHHAMVGMDLRTLERGLVSSTRKGHVDVALLRQMADRYGTRAIAVIVDRALRHAEARS